MEEALLGVGRRLAPVQPILEAAAMLALSGPMGGGGGGIAGLGLSARAAATGVQANRIAGLAAEAVAARQLTAQGYTILGSHVGARTSKGLRVIDHLVQAPDGSMVAIEVKSGGAVRNASQVAKDALMSSEGAVLVGKNAPAALRGTIHQLPTVVIRP